MLLTLTCRSESQHMWLHLLSLPLPACTTIGISLNLTVAQLCSYEHTVKMLLWLPRLIHIVLKSRQTGSIHRGRQFDISEEINHTKEFTLQGFNPGRHQVPSFPLKPSPAVGSSLSPSEARYPRHPMPHQCKLLNE